MINSELIDEFDEQYRQFRENNITFESFMDELSYYERYIPQFFSKKGEAPAIRKMYTDIKESKNHVSVPIVETASAIYSDYLDGMVVFVNEVSKATSVQESAFDALHDKFEKARKNDSVFVESIYGGSLNQPVDMVLTEACQNIEYLIDFMPRIQTIKNQCQALYESADYITDESTKSLMNDSLGLLYESVSHYCYNTLRNVLITYEKIEDSLHDGSSSDVTTEQFVLL